MGPRENDNVENLVCEARSMSFLKKGDRIRLVRTGRREVIYATVDMDGHAVSTNYGTLCGNTYYEDPSKNYINVKFDHVRYSVTHLHPNDSIKERDGWKIFVTMAVGARINDATRGARTLTRCDELEEKLEEAARIIARVHAELAQLR